jgi:hypothetical protein
MVGEVVPVDYGKLVQLAPQALDPLTLYISILKKSRRRLDLSRPPSNMKQKHISIPRHRSLEVGIKSPPSPLAAIEEVVQAKLMEECTRRAWELNLKVRGLPLPLPSLDAMVVGTLFLKDNLGL